MISLQRIATAPFSKILTKTKNFCSISNSDMKHLYMVPCNPSTYSKYPFPLPPSQNPYTARSNGFGRDCMWLSEDFVNYRYCSIYA